MGAGEDREADRVGVLLEHRLHDLLGRLVQAGVDDLHAGVTQRAGDDLRPPVVSVEAGLGHDHADLPLVCHAASRIPPRPNLTPVRRAALVVLLAAALTGCGDERPAADAGPRFETVVQDDALLLHRPAELPRTIRTLKALGVDRVRITASFSQIAPTEDGRRNWSNLDRAVRAVSPAACAR